MFKSKKDFNEITVRIKLECDYEHPLDTAKNVYALLNSVYKYFDMFSDNYFKKAIDVNILKSLTNKIKEYLNDLEYYESLIESTKKQYKEHYKILTEDDGVIVSYALPTSSVEITLSELVIMYRTLELCIQEVKELEQHIFLSWNEPNYYYSIKQIQKYLNSRLGYALMEPLSEY